jgi:DNA-binding transcriptional LysR family regulator
MCGVSPSGNREICNTLIPNVCENNWVFLQDIRALGASMNSIRMDEITAFLAVVEARSFAGAGRLLGRDASIISRRVSALEARLGVRLLERSTRRVAPTEAGLRFSEKMRAATDAMEEAEAEASEASSAATGTLRLALPTTFGRLRIAPMLPDFLRAYPKVSIEAEYADRCVDLLAEGFDVAIRLGELQDTRVIAKKLAPHRRLICAAPSYLAIHGTPQVPADLGKHACLGFSRFAGHPEWRFRQGDRVSSVRVSGPLTANSIQSLITAALAGMGIVMCSDWLAAPERAAGYLKPLLTDWSVEGEGGIYIVRSSARFTPAKTRSFVDWISERWHQPLRMVATDTPKP